MPKKAESGSSRSKAQKSEKALAIRPAVTPVSTGTPDRSVSKPFTIVGIGASAGGLSAIEAFLRSMSVHAHQRIAFVIVQHLSPDHKSILAELVQRCTQMKVFEAKDAMEVAPGCVYIIPPNKDMGILDGKLQLFELHSASRVRHSIDFFFRSLAADQGRRAVAIVLSGTGTDGTLGVREVKAEGGMAIAQTPDSTEFDSMPRSAIATGLVDYALPPAEMPPRLVAYTETIVRQRLPKGQTDALQSLETLAKICIVLRTSTGHDFSQYKETTIVRRVERRMALHQIDRMTDYLRYMQTNTVETSALFRDLLIGVTRFFRDPDAFASLESIAIPRLLKSTTAANAIRVWVCGCSTGEEAYSIAIMIQEQLERAGQIRNLRIFATDLDRHATDQARSGSFPPSIADEISPERLKRFFTLGTDGSYRVEKSIRDQLIFSQHDVLKDPPFSKLDLISCRNLLIYLNGDLQKRLIPLFHYALNPQGILFLGNAEGVGDHPLLFDTLDRKAKIYARNGESSSDLRLQSASAFSREVQPVPLVVNEVTRSRKPGFRELVEQLLLTHFNCAAVLVSDRGEIVYFHGHTGNYLEPAQGNVTSNILTMARDGLRRDLTASLHRVVSKNQSVCVSGLEVRANGQVVNVNLTILPAGIPNGSSGDLFLVVLEEKPIVDLPQALVPKSDGISGPFAEQAAVFEQKIRAKDEYIQTIVEEMESSSEELKSSNEEMQSVNEEMQSANEELETSREELQSVNEELATLNAELLQKVADLSRANNDMNNLLAGTGVGTLFVDHQLRIARFTPSITQIIKFIETDVGRPLEDIVSNIVGYERLLIDVQTVLSTLVPIEIEVSTKNGTWYTLSIRPYRTLENVIEGGVITFVDITQRKLAERALAEAERFRQAAQIETVGIAFFRINGHLTSANEAFLHMVGHSRDDLDHGRLDWALFTPPEWMPRHIKAQENLRASGRTDPYECEYLRGDGSRGGALFAVWRLSENEAVVYSIGIGADRFYAAHAAST